MPTARRGTSQIESQSQRQEGTGGRQRVCLDQTEGGECGIGRDKKGRQGPDPLGLY